jgi:flagellar assembly protein FliH
LYSKVFKNCQVSIGTPFQIKAPICFETLQNKNFDRPISLIEENYDTENPKAENPKYILQTAQNSADLILQEAELEAARIIEKSTEQAERMVLEAEAKIKQLSEAEAIKGYEYGYTEAQKQYESLLDEAACTREQAKTEYSEILAGMEANIISLVLDIARKVTGMELSTNREALLSLVTQAIGSCSSREGIVLKVSEEDYAFILESNDRIKAMTGIDDIAIKKDITLTKGGCIVDTYFGSVDAGFETKMKKIEEAFKQISGIG